MEWIYISLISYFIGAVPFAYVIGMFLYHTDVRKHGSGNLGGSNTGRVLGGKAGVMVMTLDLLKVTLCVYLALQIRREPLAASCGAFWAAFGHCYPVYVRFRGGKAVAALYGFLFGLWICAGYSCTVFLFPLIAFLLVLLTYKIVSLSSILSSIFAVIYLSIVNAHISVTICAAALAALILLRHKGNIQRMFSGTERKITWLN